MEDVKWLLKKWGFLIFILLTAGIAGAACWGRSHTEEKKVAEEVWEPPVEVKDGEMITEEVEDGEMITEEESDMESSGDSAYWFLPQSSDCLISEEEKEQLESTALSAAESVKEIYKDVIIADAANCSSGVSEFTREQRRAVVEQLGAAGLVSVEEDGEIPSSYSDFVKNSKKYIDLFKAFDEKQPDNDKKILREISTFDKDVDEDDEAKWNRTDNDYYWDPDSALSFVPQEAGFYILTLNVEDSVLPGKTAEGIQVVEVRNPIDTIPSQSQWLEENVVSVVLFAISGVLAIIVVVLFLVKPSDKKVEEIDLEKLKGKKKKTDKK